MELEELKSAWAQYDKKINLSIKLNEEVLRKITLDKAERKTNALMHFHLADAITGIAILLYALSLLYKFLDEVKFLIPALILVICSFPIMIISLKRINLFHKLDYYNSSIIELQKALIEIKRKSVLYKKAVLFSIPPITVCLLILINKSIHNIDYYQKPMQLITILIVATILDYMVIYFIGKYFYEKNLNKANIFLEELKRFESEK